MKKIKLSFIGDALFLFLTAFVFFYGTLKPKIIKPVLTAVVSALLSSVLTILYTAFSVYRYGKKYLLKSEEDRYLAFSNYLSFASGEELDGVIISYFSKGYDISLSPRRKGLFSSDKKVCVFYDFNPDGATKQSVLTAYKKTSTAYTLIFIATSYDAGVSNFFAPLSKRIKLYTAKDLYLSLKKYNLLPSITKTKPEKKSLEKLLKPVLRREKSIKFALWGCLIILTSTISYYKTLYLIVGGAFLIFSCYLRLFTNPTQKTEKLISI